MTTKGDSIGLYDGPKVKQAVPTLHMMPDTSWNDVTYVASHIA